MDDTKHNQENNSGSFMYYRDYSREADIDETIKHNHKTEGALVAKVAARLHGRGGRLRGKSGAKENNKARGGRLAR